MKRTAVIATTLLAVFFLTSGGSANAQRNSLPQRVEVAFVLDTTGSMRHLIEGAKRKIWSIANTIVDHNANADIRMALVGYRDFGDEYVVKTRAMTSDLDKLYGELLQFSADGGGDQPEAVNEALNAAISKLHWTPGDDTVRLVFLVGDAPPHMDYNGPQYPEILSNAVSRDIVVNAVQAGRNAQTRRSWQEIALLGGGDFIPIPQDGGSIVVIETPYDSDIIILQREIDRTVVPYGSDRRMKELQAKLARKAQAESSVMLDASRYYSKRSSNRSASAGPAPVVVGRGDLVSDFVRRMDGKLTLNVEDLPDILKEKSEAERMVYLQDLAVKRRDLQTKMAQLITKRDRFVASERLRQDKPAADSFDRAVERTITKVLKRRES